MKIIKPGSIPVPSEFKGRCHHCGCEFICVEEDLLYRRESSWSGVLEYVYTRCPTCGQTVSNIFRLAPGYKT